MYTIAKQIYTELFRLYNCGWNIWITKVFALSEQYGISFNGIGTRNFKLDSKHAVKIRFESQWLADSQNVRKNPVLWSYSLYKHGLYFESYLNSISNVRHRTAKTKLRTSLHVLEIERGWYTVPKTAVYDRLCKTCYQIEDEEHFLINCKKYDPFDENSILKYLLEPLNSHYWTIKKSLYSSCRVWSFYHELVNKVCK